MLHFHYYHHYHYSYSSLPGKTLVMNHRGFFYPTIVILIYHINRCHIKCCTSVRLLYQNHNRKVFFPAAIFRYIMILPGSISPTSRRCRTALLFIPDLLNKRRRMPGWLKNKRPCDTLDWTAISQASGTTLIGIGAIST